MSKFLTLYNLILQQFGDNFTPIPDDINDATLENDLKLDWINYEDYRFNNNYYQLINFPIYYKTQYNDTKNIMNDLSKLLVFWFNDTWYNESNAIIKNNNGLTKNLINQKREAMTLRFNFDLINNYGNPSYNYGAKQTYTWNRIKFDNIQLLKTIRDISSTLYSNTIILDLNNLISTSKYINALGLKTQLLSYLTSYKNDKIQLTSKLIKELLDKIGLAGSTTGSAYSQTQVNASSIIRSHTIHIPYSKISKLTQKEKEIIFDYNSCYKNNNLEQFKSKYGIDNINYLFPQKALSKILDVEKEITIFEPMPSNKKVKNICLLKDLIIPWSKYYKIGYKLLNNGSPAPFALIKTYQYVDQYNKLCQLSDVIV